MAVTCKKLFESFFRKKPHEALFPEIELKRCFTTVDLVSLGVGTIVGGGLYVAIGEMARDTTGPSVVLSIILASFSAILSALSFAEYGSRFPDAGSSYIYTYATLGEVWAFVVGWNIALEFLLTGAGLARTCSQLIDSASGGKIFLFFSSRFAYWHVPGQDPFPDLIAPVLVFCVAAILYSGAQSSTNFHNVITAVNLTVIGFIVVFGVFFGDVHHWTDDFIPHGIQGVLQGAATAFFAFSGFDIVAEAAEEALAPEKNIPWALCFIITISTLSYVGVAIVLTLMVSYRDLSAFAPLAEAFQRTGFSGAKYIIICGGICATVSALFCAVYSTSRVVYSMAIDGLLFRWFSKVHAKTHVPGRAIIVSGIITSLLAMIFEVNQLVQLTCIGTLVAYTKVTISVLVTRYQPGVQSVTEHERTKTTITQWLKKLLSNINVRGKPKKTRSMEDYKRITSQEEPPCSSYSAAHSSANDVTASRAELAVFILVMSCVALAVVSTHSIDYIRKGKWWPIFLTCLFAGSCIVSLVVIQLQPQNTASFPFMVPCVPYTPALTILINVMLLASLHPVTYARFGVWMAIGVLIYLCYGYRHSSEGMRPTAAEDGALVVIQETPQIKQNITKLQLQ